MDKEECLLLIDGNSIINRAFFALPPLSNREGVPTQGVFGFTTMLLKAISDYRPKYIAVAFDLKAPTFRHKMYEGYKATRKKMPDELAVQLPILKEQLRLMNIHIAEKEGYEADDVIGTLSKRFGIPTYIVTGDRDSFQLIDENTRVILTKRGITETLVLDTETLKSEYGLTPGQVVDYKALAGDTSDNIPGVPGVGEKTATALIGDYGSLAGVYEHLSGIQGKLRERLEAGKESAQLSYKLATIDTAAPVECELSELTYDYPFAPSVRAFFAANNFKTLFRRDDLFVSGSEEAAIARENDFVETRLNTTDELRAVLSAAERFSLIVGEDIRLSTDGKTEYVLPIMRTLVDPGAEYGAALDALAPFLADAGKRKILYDAKKVKHTLASRGAETANYDDAKLLQHLADMRVRHETPAELVENAGYDKNFPAAAMFRLTDELKAKLGELGMTELYERAELPLIDVLYDMERRGVKVDVKLLAELGDKLISESEAIADVIYGLAGKRFNINSPRQLAAVLFEDLGIEYPKRSGKHSTSAEILEQISSEHEIVPLVSKYRFLYKLNSTYIEGIRRLLTADNVIHTDYKQMLTTTGRLSSAEPNLQNIPVREEEGKRLRGLFVAREGHTLVSADYSQIELRVLAHFSQDPIMLALYNDGEDIHSRTAAEIFGVPIGEVTPGMRREAKTVNFGIIYGISDYGLSQSLKCSVATARRYMERYFERFAAIKPYLDGVVEETRRTGYARTILGRMRYIPEINSSNRLTRSFGERAAMNMPLQGSAADIIKLAMVDVAARLKGMKSKLILQIHDELIVEASDDEVEAVKALLTECMENAVKLRVPLTVDVSCGKSWIDC